MKFLLLCLASIFHLSSFAQELVSSSGSHHQTNTIQVSWSLGEISVSDYTATNINWTEGVHQPIISISGIDLLENVKDQSVIIFPNPAGHELFIGTVDGIEFAKLEILGVDGQIIIRKELDGEQMSLDVSSLSSGSYILNIYDKTSLFLTRKIIKK